METPATTPALQHSLDDIRAATDRAAVENEKAIDRVLIKRSGFVREADARTASTYRKRPVTVEAIQWQGDNLEAVQSFVGIMENMDGDASTVRFLELNALNSEGKRIWFDSAARLWVEANHSWLPVIVGEWILKDAAGFYPCKAEIFASSYEPA